MAARLIRDGLLDSEAVLSLPVEARWLYVTILLSADDCGLFEATPFRLARVADVRRELADRLVMMLVDSDLVRLYEVNGKRYGFIPKYRQRLQIKRPKHPVPPDALFLDEPDTLNRIKDLASNPTVDFGGSRKSTAAQPSELEVEAEHEEEPIGETECLGKGVQGARLAPDVAIDASVVTQPKAKPAKRARKKPAVDPDMRELTLDEISSDTGADRVVVGAWVAARSEKGVGAVTPGALALLRAEAVKAGIEAADAIAECGSRGWAGFKAKWLENDRVPRGGAPGRPDTSIKSSTGELISIDERNRRMMAMLGHDDPNNTIEG